MRFTRTVRPLAVAGLVFLSACASGGARATTGSSTAEVVIVNGSNATIYRIMMSPTNQQSWGPDRLGSNVLQTSSSFRLYNITPGRWDIRIVDRAGLWKEFRNQNFRPGVTYTLRVTSGGWHR